MRLINADEYSGKCICSHKYSGVTRIIRVDDIPTAFDIEKVIAELRKLKTYKIDLAEHNE